MPAQESRTELISITPSTSMLEAHRNTNLGWKKALAELIDNSLDAGSQRIEVETGKRQLRITDDGHGCDRIEKMLQLGGHYQRKSTKLGRYGVGLKDAALWLWGSTQIYTVSGDQLRTVFADWEKLVKSDVWSLEKREYEVTPESCAMFGIAATGGTTILFQKVERSFTGFDAAREELIYTFAPAITQGKQIIFTDGKKRDPLPAFQFPLIDDAIDKMDTIDGRSFRLKAGIIREGQTNPYPGFSIAYKHRILFATTNGCGHYGVRRFYGYVQLLDGWKLSRNKDAVIDGMDQLYERLFDLCSPILAKTSEFAQDFHLRSIAQNISSRLSQILKTQNNSKEKRGGGENKGTVIPTNNGNKRLAATTLQTGKNKMKSIAGGAKIEFLPLGEDSLGQVEITSFVRIQLSTDHPAIAHFVATDNQLGIGMNAIYLLAREMSFNREYLIGNFKEFQDSDAQDNLDKIAAKLLSDFFADFQQQVSA